jgi:hypothetical protein
MLTATIVPMPRQKPQGDSAEWERFFIRATADTKRRLAHLAIDLDTGTEKLAGILLAEYLPTVEAEVKAGKRKAGK